MAFATTSHHVLRGYARTRRAGLDAEGVAAPTRWWLWPHAFLREFVGLVAAEGVPMPIALAIIVVTYGAAERATLLGQVT